MASPKALAAIALTLIVAMPLCLGYALANEETTAEEWQSTNTVNVSEALLNSSSPIYADYTDSLNNSLLIRASGNMNSYAPGYVKISENYTSLPIYNSGTGTVTLADPTTGSKTIGSGNNLLIGVDSSVNPHVQGLQADIIQVSGNFTTSVSIETYSESISMTAGNQTLTFFRFYYNNGPGDQGYAYELTYNGNTYQAAWFYFTSPSNVALTYKYNDFALLSLNYDFWSINFGNIALMLKLENNADPVIIHTLTAQTLTKINDLVIFNGLTYSGVREIYIADVKNPNTHTYTYQTTTGTYADPAYGWTLSGQFTMRWSNTFHNEYVRMLIHFQGDTTTQLRSQNTSFSNVVGTVRFDYVESTGFLQLQQQDFGYYSDVMVEFYKDKTVVTGLQNGWPSMGTMPQGFNSRTFTGSNPDEISFIWLSVANKDNVHFRIDDARVLAGSFPSTEDYTLSMTGLFPGKSFNLKLNSIGVYGSSISIGSNSYAVNNGRITVGTHSVPLKGAVISSLYNGSVYENYIGGYSVGTSSSPANVTFGGEWSLTATANIMEKVQVTERNWAPGQFVFDDQESFSGALIFAAAAAFVGVGLYGARSGNKIGLLLIVCGGVLLIAINLI